MQLSRTELLILTILTIGCIQGCSKEEMSTKESDYLMTVPLNFRSYVKEFIYDGLNYEVNPINIYKVNFQFEKLERGVVGQCSYFSNVIKIDPKYWYESDYYERKRIIYHELGHCALKQRKHRNACLDNGYTASLMIDKANPSGCLQKPGSWFFCDEFRSYYLKELFLPNDKSAKPSWTSDKDAFCFLPVKKKLNIVYNSMMPREGGFIEIYSGNQLVFTQKIDQKSGPAGSTGDTSLIVSFYISDCFEIGEEGILRIKNLDQDDIYVRTFTVGAEWIIDTRY